MAAAPAFESELGPEAGLLDAVRTETRLASEAEVRRLELAGVGAPFVSEFTVTELATASGMTTDAGKRYVGKVLEVRYRLPGHGPAGDGFGDPPHP